MTAPVQQTLIDVPRPPLTAQQLGSVLKSARDIMRKDKGLNGDIDRLPVLTWVMFLKFLDDLERQREEEADMEGWSFAPPSTRPTAGATGPPVPTASAAMTCWPLSTRT